MANEVNRIAELLLDAWKKADPKSSVALHPVSYIATFADMAKAIIEDMNTRPAPPVGGLEVVRYDYRFSDPAGNGYVWCDKISWNGQSPTASRELVTRSNAECIIAAERAEKEKFEAAWLEAEGKISDLQSDNRCLLIHGEALKADNAALTARIKELEAERNELDNIAYAAGFYQAECNLPEHACAKEALAEYRKSKTLETENKVLTARVKELEQINADLCRSHGVLNVTGAKLDTKVEALEAKLAVAEKALEVIADQRDLSSEAQFARAALGKVRS